MSTEPKPTPAAPSAGPQKLLMAGVVVILAALGFIVWLIATGRGVAPANSVAEAAGNSAAAAPAATMPKRGELLPSGLRIETIHDGTGPLVTRADTVLLRYELRVLGRQEVIQSNFNDPQPISMSAADVIPGFAEALTHIRSSGGEARFWVPPNLGYGAEPGPGAPFGPNDILEFRVRVEGIAPAGHGAPSADRNTISEEDLQNIMAAMNATEAQSEH